MAGTAERSVGMKETKGWRWNKQRRGRRGRERKYFLLCLPCCITFWPYYFLSCTESLVFNYWKHSSSPSPAKQYPAYISSRHHLTDGNIKIWWGRCWSGKWEGRGGQVSMGTADCYRHETFSKNSNMPGNYKRKRTQDKYSSYTDCTWQNVLFAFV